MPNLGCPEHLGDMDMMQQVTPPPKRPPLPRLDIPGAPSGAHLPTSAAHNVSPYTLPPHRHYQHGRIVQSADNQAVGRLAECQCLGLGSLEVPPPRSGAQRLRACTGVGHADAAGADRWPRLGEA